MTCCTAEQRGEVTPVPITEVQLKSKKSRGFKVMNVDERFERKRKKDKMKGMKE